MPPKKKISMNLQEYIKRIIREVSESVTCECGWSWKISEGGDDPYVCHKCWKDNSEEYLKEKEEMSLQESIRRILREEMGDFDWIRDTNPSLLDSIIVFEPMITEEDYGKVLNILENSGENIHTNTGSINTLNPFTYYDYLHHLLINVNGRTVYGGTNYNNNVEYDDLNDNIDDYISSFSDVFPNPTRIDGRKYFNI